MTVYRYVRTGRLPAERDGSHWTVDPADLDRMRAPGPVPRGSGSVRSEGSAKLVTRMVAGDEAGAWSTVEAALASSLEPAEIYHELLVPALRDIGTGWANGSLSIADEHGATAVAQRIIGRLGPRFARRGRKRGTVVLGAAPGDEHASRVRSSPTCSATRASWRSTSARTSRRPPSSTPPATPTGSSRS